MSIFDWMPELMFPDINTIPEEEMVRIVGEQTGLVFKKDKIWDWLAKSRKMKFSLRYGHFNLPDNHDLFIGADYQGHDEDGDYCGGSAPIDTIDGVVKYFKNAMERYGK